MNNTLNNVSEMAKDTKADYGNAISDINPEDIESISIPIRPSVSALYELNPHLDVLEMQDYREEGLSICQFVLKLANKH